MFINTYQKFIDKYILGLLQNNKGRMVGEGIK
jgi:hypothetical protein